MTEFNPEATRSIAHLPEVRALVPRVKAAVRPLGDRPEVLIACILLCAEQAGAERPEHGLELESFLQTCDVLLREGFRMGRAARERLLERGQ